MIPTLIRLAGSTSIKMPWINLSRRARIASGSRGQDFGSPIRSLKRATILPQPLGVGPRGNPQPLAQVVPQDDVPGAEKLRRQEVDDAAIAPLFAGLLQRQVVHVAVHHEQAGRAGEILLGKLAGPARKPRHDRAGALARQRAMRLSASSSLALDLASPPRSDGSPASTWLGTLRSNDFDAGSIPRTSNLRQRCQRLGRRAQLFGRLRNLGRLGRGQALRHLEFAQGIVGHGLFDGGFAP